MMCAQVDRSIYIHQNSVAHVYERLTSTCQCADVEVFLGETPAPASVAAGVASVAAGVAVSCCKGS